MLFCFNLGNKTLNRIEAIAFRLNSGLKRYKENGGKVGRKVGSIKTKEQKQEEYARVIRCWKQDKSIRDTATLCDVSVEI